MRVHVDEVLCKTILNKTPSGFAEYTANPYVGCAFGCSFCYVPAIRARRGQDGVSEWGQYVQAKVNAPEVLAGQMLKVASTARVMVGSATDPWQPVEKTYQITRRMIEILCTYPNRFSAITRSPQIMRDLDLLRKVNRLSVNFSVSTFDDRVRRAMEPTAPSVAGRVAAIQALQAAGIAVTVFWAPMIPGVADNEQAIDAYFDNLARIGIRRVMCGTLNYRDQVGERVGHVVGRLVHAGICSGSRLPHVRLVEALKVAGRIHGVTVSGMD